MPELPEVEVFKRFIDQHALDKPVQQVQIFEPKILEATTPEFFQQKITGYRFSGTLRRGKHLFVQIQPVDQNTPICLPWLFLHFGMSGYLSYGTHQKTLCNAYNDAKLKHEHVRIRFDFLDGSHLAFHEQRMFGKAGLIDNPQNYIESKQLGPDALTIDRKTFISQLKHRKGSIKPALMDQSVVAGIGNVYADEILFQCRIHPESKVACLSTEQYNDLYQHTISVLQKTVAAGADRALLPKEYLLHVRHPKGRCPESATLFDIKQIGGRTTYFCPNCQPLIGLK